MSSSLGLNVQDVVNVDIVIEGLAAQVRNFGIGIIVGDSNVINVNDRFRTYTTLSGVIADFGTTAPEYYGADSFFSQNPQPSILQIGRWAATASAGQLLGQLLTNTEQEISNFNTISTGSFTISIDGTSHNITGVDFTSDTNLNGVAATVQAKLPSGVLCVWDPTYSRFEITSSTTGTGSVVLPLTPEGTGIDISTLLNLTAAAGAISYAGTASETYTAAIAALANKSNQWYAAMPCTTATIEQADMINACALIEGLSPVRVHFVTSQDGTIPNTAYNPEDPADLPSILQVAEYQRTFVQYSSSSKYAAPAAYARAATVDFTAQNTTITLKFKSEPGISAEYLSETQGANIKAKNCNVFAAYNNSTAILQEGIMTGGYFFDEIFGTDWLQNWVQTNLWNLFITSTTKIPQTDAGMHQIVNNINASLAQGVVNGLLGPGVYEGPSFGSISTGDTLAAGYYTYAPPVATQAQATRAARIAPTVQVAACLAGAVHFANVIINVTR